MMFDEFTWVSMDIDDDNNGVAFSGALRAPPRPEEFCHHRFS
jgi:hypothetical protein